MPWVNFHTALRAAPPRMKARWLYAAGSIHGHYIMGASSYGIALPRFVFLLKGKHLPVFAAQKTRYNVCLRGHCTMVTLQNQCSAKFG